MTPPREPHVATEATATSSDVPVVDPRTGAYDDATPWSGDAIFACAGEMAERMAAHPWDRNVLGPPAQWPPVLRTTVSMVLRSKYPITLTWGEQFVMLYNDAYVPVLGEKHPDALGSPLAEQFPEIWDAIGPMQRAVLQGGEATWDENLPLVLERGDGPEECFFTFSYSPVPDGDQPGGVLAVLSMTTSEVLGARRLAILNDVGAVSASDPKTAAAAIAAALDRHPSELPGGRVWLSEDAATVVAAAFGEPGPALEAPTPAVGPTILGAGRTAWLGLGGPIDPATPSPVALRSIGRATVLRMGPRPSSSSACPSCDPWTRRTDASWTSCPRRSRSGWRPRAPRSWRRSGRRRSASSTRPRPTSSPR